MKTILEISLLLIALSCQNINRSEVSRIDEHDSIIFQDTSKNWIQDESRGLEIIASQYKHIDDNIFAEIAIPLSNGPIPEYRTSNKKDSLELHFDDFANEYWENVVLLSEIDSVPFEADFFNEGTFKSSIERIIVEDTYTLLLLKMNPVNGEPWNGGICPGLGWIIRMNHTNKGYSYAGSTGRFKYSFKYGKSPTSIEVRNKNSTPYLEVRTDAGGVGQGREGIVLYKMNPFGEIIFNNIYLTFYSDIRWLPKDTARSMWAFEFLKVNPSDWDGNELHVESNVELDYKVSSDLKEIQVGHLVNTVVFTYSNRVTGQEMYSDTIPEFSFRQFYTLSKD